MGTGWGPMLARIDQEIAEHEAELVDLRAAKATLERLNRGPSSVSVSTTAPPPKAHKPKPQKPVEKCAPAKKAAPTGRPKGWLRVAIHEVLGAAGKELDRQAIHAALTKAGHPTTIASVDTTLSAMRKAGGIGRSSAGGFYLPAEKSPKPAPVTKPPIPVGKNPLDGVHPGKLLTVGKHRAVEEDGGLRCKLCGRWARDRLVLNSVDCNKE